MNPVISCLTIKDQKTINQEVGLLVKAEEGNSIEAALQDSDIEIIPESMCEQMCEDKSWHRCPCMGRYKW